MTIRFGNNRLATYIVIWLLSGAVLGIAAHFADIFLPKYHREFIIFALVVPSVTIFVLLLSVSWAQPWSEAIMLFILSVLWLAMGAWTTDVIGHIQCSMTSGTEPTKSGTISSRTYCYEMRVIQAFSWMICGLLILYFVIFIALVNRAVYMGFPHIWNEHIAFMPWFGEWPTLGHGNAYGPHMMYPGMHQPFYVPQQLGQPVMIQPGYGGMPVSAY